MRSEASWTRCLTTPRTTSSETLAGTTEVGHNDRQQLVCVDQSALLPSHAAVLGSGQLALACDDGSVRTWSTVTRQWTSRCFHPRGARPVLLASSPWRRHIASAHDDGSVVVWNTETASALRMAWPEGRRVDALTFSHDGKWLTVLSTDEVIRFFDSNGVVRRQVPIGGQPSPILARVIGGNPDRIFHSSTEVARSSHHPRMGSSGSSTRINSFRRHGRIQVR